MALPSSGILTIDDIYQEAVTVGSYTGGKFLEELRDWGKWSPAVPASGNVFISDFYGVSALAPAAPTIIFKFKNNTGNVLTLADLAPNQDWFNWYPWKKGANSIQAGPNISINDSTSGLTIGTGATYTYNAGTWNPYNDNETDGFTFRLQVDNSGEFSNMQLTCLRVPPMISAVTIGTVSAGTIKAPYAIGGSGVWGWERAVNEAGNDPSAHNYFGSNWELGAGDSPTLTFEFIFS